jgi:penicillin amidase
MAVRGKRIFFGLCIGVLFIGAAGSFWAHRLLSESLPTVDGELVLAGLAAPVVVERDAVGVPTLRGEGRVDVARALGFVHAQERFFQMDLMRRRAAGELAELLGASAIDVDRYHRVHRMRERARRVVGEASPNELAVLSAYVEGVNAGLATLDGPPFEYLLMRSNPAPWRAEDSVLVVFSMFFELNDDRGALESARGLVRDVLHPDLAEFLSPAGTEWDAPLFGAALVPAPIPGPGVVELGTPSSARLELELEADIGSNNWAVAGAKTRDGGALLANDMHLGHTVPNLWFRAVMSFGKKRLVGVTLPGTPSLVAGSNGDIAWGFTNTGGDWVDLVEIESDPRDPDRYRTPSGVIPFEIHRETIAVRGEAAVELDVRETVWGPVIDQDHRGRARALRWIAHDPSGVNLRLGVLEETTTVREALTIAPTVGIPPQNFVVADRQGSIGWTVAGRIPRRIGFDGSVPGSWASGERAWGGFLAAEEYPRLSNPPSGVIWTANARVVEGEMLQKMGDGGYALGARAKQIRDSLLALESATEKDMLVIQLDDRALFLERWRELFLEVARSSESLADLEKVLDRGWTARASIDSAGYRAVRDLRRAVFQEVIGTLTAEASRADPRFRPGQLRQWEGPLWQLVSERPAHLVPPPYESWEEWLRAIVSETAASWPRPLEKRTWGEANSSAITHPLSPGLPFLSRFLDAKSRPLPGHTDMPRVQGPSEGASERLVVSPGREAEGLFHMPGGQSGHPLSPYYLAGHEDWEEGRATPLLPGTTVLELTLIPRGTPSRASTSRSRRASFPRLSPRCGSMELEARRRRRR